jgi:hypothetical protein
MKIDAAFQKSYPELAKWVTDELPKVSSKAKVWKAFLKYGELKEADARKSVKAGADPTLKSANMPGANGEFKGPTHPNTVFLAEAICKRFRALLGTFCAPCAHVVSPVWLRLCRVRVVVGEINNYLIRGLDSLKPWEKQQRSA